MIFEGEKWKTLEKNASLKSKADRDGARTVRLRPSPSLAAHARGLRAHLPVELNADRRLPSKGRVNDNRATMGK